MTGTSTRKDNILLEGNLNEVSRSGRQPTMRRTLYKVLFSGESQLSASVKIGSHLPEN